MVNDPGRYSFYGNPVHEPLPLQCTGRVRYMQPYPCMQEGSFRIRTPYPGHKATTFTIVPGDTALFWKKKSPTSNTREPSMTQFPVNIM